MSRHSLGHAENKYAAEVAGGDRHLRRVAAAVAASATAAVLLHATTRLHDQQMQH